LSAGRQFREELSVGPGGQCVDIVTIANRHVEHGACSCCLLAQVCRKWKQQREINQFLREVREADPEARNKKAAKPGLTPKEMDTYTQQIDLNSLILVDSVAFLRGELTELPNKNRNERNPFAVNQTPPAGTPIEDVEGQRPSSSESKIAPALDEDDASPSTEGNRIWNSGLLILFLPMETVGDMYNLNNVDDNKENKEEVVEDVTEHPKSPKSYRASDFGEEIFRKQIICGEVDRNTVCSICLTEVFEDPDADLAAQMTGMKSDEEAAENEGGGVGGGVQLTQINRDTNPHSTSDANVLRRVRRCGHYFHKSCVEMWLAQRPQCPMCMQYVRVERENRLEFLVENGLTNHKKKRSTSGRGVSIENWSKAKREESKTNSSEKPEEDQLDEQWYTPRNDGRRRRGGNSVANSSQAGVPTTTIGASSSRRIVMPAMPSWISSFRNTSAANNNNVAAAASEDVPENANNNENVDANGAVGSFFLPPTVNSGTGSMMMGGGGATNNQIIPTTIIAEGENNGEAANRETNDRVTTEGNPTEQGDEVGGIVEDESNHVANPEGTPGETDGQTGVGSRIQTD